MTTMTFGGSATNQKTYLKHPVGLFILFFSEMWERFSYYGMRAILVLFMTSELVKGGFGWDRSEALLLYGWYTGLVYLTPVIGGWVADNYIGFRKSIIIGAILMTFGHAVMAVEWVSTFYLGLILIIIGNGFFKSNIASMVGNMYPEGSPLKDSAYTIFYMGVNAGAFLGMIICGWLGETQGWTYGFSAAGIFMFFGMLQFYFGQKIFGKIGLSPKNEQLEEENDAQLAKNDEQAEQKVPFVKSDTNHMIFAISAVVLTVLFVIFKNSLFAQTPEYIYYALVLTSVLAITYFIVKRLSKYPKIERDRLTVIIIFAFFVFFFWMAFEQAGGALTIFARDYTDRSLPTPMLANIYKIVSLCITVIPMVLLSWVLIMVSKRIMKEFPLTILFTATSFIIIWGVVIVINVYNFNVNEVEVPASWFGSLNSLVIISFAPLFSMLWPALKKRGKNPSGPLKFTYGLLLMSLSFGLLVIGSLAIPQGAQTASVSMIWLIAFYYFMTLGELCISPIGLSYVSKLSPKRLLGMMFGAWYLANFAANLFAGIVGSYIDVILHEYSMSVFLGMFVVVSGIAAVIIGLLNNFMKKKMHGVS